MNGPLFGQFATRAGLPGDAALRQVINAVQAIPYGRPRSRTAEGVLGEWKGTCSTKHALLAQLLRERWPESQPRLVHRVYRVSLRSALQRYGDGAAGAVPAGGLTDVHRYLMIILAGQEVTIDITFPGDQAWDGRRSMCLACGEGRDFPAGMIPMPIRPRSKPVTATRRFASPSSPSSRSHQGRRALPDAQSAHTPWTRLPAITIRADVLSAT
jgi:hypothetical protein